MASESIPEKPKFIENPNIDDLKKSLEAHINYLYSDDYHEDNDEKYYLYEAVMEAFYGKEIFDKLNKEVFSR